MPEGAYPNSYEIRRKVRSSSTTTAGALAAHEGV